MSDEIFLPPELLPRETRYRPAIQSVWGSLVRRAAWLAFLWALLTIIYAIASRFTILPMNGTDLWLILVGAHLAIAAARTVQRRRRADGQLLKYKEGLRLLEGGELTRAGVILEELCGTSRETPWLHTLVIAARGKVFLLSGNPDQALSMFAAALFGGWLTRGRSTEVQGAPEVLSLIALSYAIKNDMPHAEFWQGIAHDQLTPDARGMLAVLDAIIGIRNGRYAIVAKDTADALEKAGATPSQQRLLCLLSAFALSRINQNGAQEKQISELLERAGPVEPERLGYLSAHWAELGEFLAAHAVVSRQDAETQRTA